MACIGYARVSSVGQSLDLQLDRLAHCDRIFCEKQSGASSDRPELKTCLAYLREGDTLEVTKMDRLARSAIDLYRIVAELAEREVGFRILDDPLVDTTSRTGKMALGLLAVIAEFENDIRRERQREGIARARAAGVQFGPPPKVTERKAAEVREALAEGQRVADIVADTGLSRSTIYRIRANVAEPDHGTAGAA